MKKALGWVFIIAMLILIVRMVSAQAMRAMPQQARHSCSPAQVWWHTDSLKVYSVGCVDFRKDSLIIIQSISNDGEPHDARLLLKPMVDSIALLQPVQKAVMKRQGG